MCLFLVVGVSFTSTSLAKSKGAYEVCQILELQDVNQQPHKIYEVVDEMPKFPGGEKAMFEWLGKNVKYPEATETGGRVIVRFIVSETGKVENAEVIKGFNPAFDAEAKKIVEKMPDWNPGKNHGKAVPVYFTLPIAFQPNAIKFDAPKTQQDKSSQRNTIKFDQPKTKNEK